MVPRKTTVSDQMLAIAVLRHGELSPRGTGFLIGQSLAFTAAHLVGDVFKVHDSAGCRVVAVQVVERCRSPLLWNVREISRSPSESGRDDRPLDIALLHLEQSGEPLAGIEQHRQRFFGLDVAAPKLGQHVVAYGFARSALRQNAADLPFDMSHSLRRVEGLVSGVNWPYRDRVLLPFPCFAVEANFDPGMSGGPIFDDQDQVCGMISAGGMDGISWGSVLWPSLGMSLHGKYLLDHAREGQIRARNLHCVSLHENDDGSAPRLVFDPSAIGADSINPGAT